jgi:hypothetical protein
MIPTARPVLVAVALVLAVSASVSAQETAPRPQEAPAAGPAGQEVVESLPKVPDLPASLLAPAPPPSPCWHDPLAEPYFAPDPLLDPPQFPPPGWFAGVDADVLKAHVNNQLVSPVPAPGGRTITLALPSAPLDWTVSPRVFAGYRLPSGFGEFYVAYRGMATRGSEGIIGPDGPATVTSRFDLNVFDLDYSSREFSLWYCGCDMRWFVGARTVFLYFDTEVDQPFAQAAAGNGIVGARETNYYAAVGPHAGVELSRRLGDTGLTLCLSTDLTTAWPLGRVTQAFSADYTTPGPDGRLLAGASHDAGNWTAAIVQAQAGVSWQPPAYPDFRLFLGYQFEYWFNVGKTFDFGSSADVWDQGFLLQAAYRF